MVCTNIEKGKSVFFKGYFFKTHGSKLFSLRTRVILKLVRGLQSSRIKACYDTPFQEDRLSPLGSALDTILFANEGTPNY